MKRAEALGYLRDESAPTRLALAATGHAATSPDRKRLSSGLPIAYNSLSGGMHATKPKLILTVAGVLILTMVGTLFFVASKKPDFRLSFVCATNDSAGFCWGVFRLENHSTNYAGIDSGEFQVRSGFGWVPAGSASGGVLGAKPFGPPLVGPGVITFKTTLPAAANQYRLVVDIVPFASVNGLAIAVPATNSLQYRIGTRLARYNLLSVLPSKLQVSLFSNMRHLSSESFRSPARKP